jgi:hypothetical protein
VAAAAKVVPVRSSAARRSPTAEVKTAAAPVRRCY